MVELIQEYYEFDGHPFEGYTVRKALAKILPDNSLVRVWLIQHEGGAIGYSEQ